MFARARGWCGGAKRGGGRIGPAAFTLIELMIVVAIIGVLIAILVPATSSAIEMARRLRCRANLRSVHQSLVIYGNEHDGLLPIAEGRGGWLNAVGQARDAQPRPDQFTPISATMWAILKSTGLTAEVFVCPSAGHKADPAGPLDPDVWDFASASHLSYAIQYPYGERTYLGRATFSPSQMPVMADRGPFFGDGGDLDAMPAGTEQAALDWLDLPANRTKVNSANHGGAGQNVLFADGHADWIDRPTRGPRGDNIYTVQEDDTPLGRLRGVVPGRSPDRVEPAGPLDSVLVY